MKAAARSLVWAVAIRPWCWPVAVTQILRLARPGWWHRWPPVPLPDAALWKFRMETAYGGTGEAEPEVEDMRSFLHWSRDMRQWRRR